MTSATYSSAAVSDALEQFRDAIANAGLTPPDDVEADGRLHRFGANGKRHDDSGWYVLHGDGIPAGAYGDWRTGVSETWRADIGRTLSRAEEAAHRARVEAMRRERDAELARRHAAARERAAQIWRDADLVPDDHAYLRGKGVRSHGLRMHDDGRLVVPMRDAEGVLHSLQFIAADGEKRYLTGGRVHGCYYAIGRPDGTICICEGYATGASVHEATGHAVAIAFAAGNLLSVARALRAKYPDATLVLCADDDHRTDGNPGLTKATEAARAVGGLLAVPEFGEDRPEGATDYNDLVQHRGAEAVAASVARARAPDVGGPSTSDDRAPANESALADDAADTWPPPQPLTTKIVPEPYPVDALPATIRGAIEEVQHFTKAPIALVASSALAALSVAAQAHIDVRRSDRLQGPTSLFLLTIADSGERKSTCDSFFSSALRDYEKQQAEAAAPDTKRYAAELAAWSAEREGILAAIKGAGKGGKPTEKLRRDLLGVEDHKPAPPRVPRLIYADATPEALAWSLAKHWPAGGILSSEGGLVFGAHAMGRDSIMRNLAMLNCLWDASPLHVDRRTSESFTVRGARLTVALQIQEHTLREFFDRANGLARGSGFLARFLIAWPPSTQGTRTFSEAPASWPKLAAFHRRIAEILARHVPIGDDGSLSPALISLTPSAKEAWVSFHDAVEAELRAGGELHDVRDVASKAADNAARLAALFQVFEHDAGDIGADVFEGASRIVAWHLSEARRFFGEFALPSELADAGRLDAWLTDRCGESGAPFVAKNHVRQHGPLRDGARLDAALRELSDLDRVRVTKDDRRLTIRLNPALVGGVR